MVSSIENKIIIDGKKVEFEFKVRKVLEFESVIIVLINDETVVPNNVVAIDYTGKQLWKINDILNIKKPTGNVDIEKTLENTLNIFSTLGMIFSIDIKKKELIAKNYLR